MASNCISFVIDEVPFIQSQMAVQLKQAEQVTALESQCHNVTEELQSHIMGIQEQLMKMLGAQWNSLFKSKGPT